MRQCCRVTCVTGTLRFVITYGEKLNMTEDVDTGENPTNGHLVKGMCGLMPAVIDYCHDLAREKGFWDEAIEMVASVRADKAQSLRAMIVNHRIALIASETGELTEATRHVTQPSEHIPEFTAEEEEAADILIRLFDLSGFCGWRLGGAVEAKLAFNSTRPSKHGKLH